MKMIIAFVCTLGTVLMSYAQDINQSDVPAEVMEAFESRFQDARDVEWEKKGDNFEVDFDLDRVDHTAYIDAAGKLILYKSDIKTKDIPEAVKNTIETDFKDYKIDDADYVEKDGEKFYEVELDSKAEDREVVFTENGEVTENAFSLVD